MEGSAATISYDMNSKDTFYKTTSEMSLISDNNDFQSCMFRRRKRSYDDYDSDSDESVDKWLKIDDEFESQCGVDVERSHTYQGFIRHPSMKRWKEKSKLRTTYSLRPRSNLRKCWSDGDADALRKGSGKGSRCRAANRATLSKYRRNTANARERERMKEINTAFTALRGVLPSFATAQMSSMTKITTLQLASSYIRALSDMLKEPVEYEESTQGSDADTIHEAADHSRTSDIADKEFNNNTCLSNLNFQSTYTTLKSRTVECSLNGSVVCHSTVAGEWRAGPSTVGGHSGGPATNCCVGERRGASDDALLDDYFLTWGDLAPLQNFHWDSN